MEITRPLTGQVSVFCYIRLPKISSVLTGFQAPKAETEKEETAEKKEAEEKEEKMEVDEKKEEEPERKKEKSEEPMETDAEKKTEENLEEKKETEGNVCVCWVVVVRGHASVWLVSVGCPSSHSVCVGLWLSEGMPVSGSFLWAASAVTAVDRETRMLAHIQTCRNLVGHQRKSAALKIDSSFQICPAFIRTSCILSGKPVNFCLLLLFR